MGCPRSAENGRSPHVASNRRVRPLSTGVEGVEPSVILPTTIAQTAIGLSVKIALAVAASANGNDGCSRIIATTLMSLYATTATTTPTYALSCLF